MIDLEEHGNSQHKEGGGSNLVPTLESEKFSEVGSSMALCWSHPPTAYPGNFSYFVFDLNFFQDESKLYQMLLNVRMELAQDIGTAPWVKKK